MLTFGGGGHGQSGGGGGGGGIGYSEDGEKERALMARREQEVEAEKVRQSTLLDAIVLARERRKGPTLADGSPAPHLCQRAVQVISFAIAAMRNLCSYGDDITGSGPTLRVADGTGSVHSESDEAPTGSDLSARIMVRLGVVSAMMHVLAPRRNDPFNLVRGLVNEQDVSHRLFSIVVHAADRLRSAVGGGGGGGGGGRGGGGIRGGRARTESEGIGSVGGHSVSGDDDAPTPSGATAVIRRLHGNPARLAAVAESDVPAGSGHGLPGNAQARAAFDLHNQGRKVEPRADDDLQMLRHLNESTSASSTLLPLPIIVDAVRVVAGLSRSQSCRRAIVRAGTLPALVPIAAHAPMSALALSKAYSFRLLRQMHEDGERTAQIRKDAMGTLTSAVEPDAETHGDELDDPEGGGAKGSSAAVPVAQQPRGLLRVPTTASLSSYRSDAGGDDNYQLASGGGASPALGSSASRGRVVKKVPSSRGFGARAKAIGVDSPPGSVAGGSGRNISPSPSKAIKGGPGDGRRSSTSSVASRAAPSRGGSRGIALDTLKVSTTKPEMGLTGIKGDVSPLLLKEQNRLEHLAVRARQQCALGLCYLAADL